MTNFFSGKKKLFAFLFLAAIALAIPLTVFVSQQQQTIKQRATEEKQTKLFFAPKGNCKISIAKDARNALSLSSAQKLDGFSLCLDTQGNNVAGFDITVSADGDFTFQKATSENGSGSKSFGISLAYDVKDKSIRFAKIISPNNNPVVTKEPVDLLRFSVTGDKGTVTLSVSSAAITSLKEKTDKSWEAITLSVEKPSLTYTVLPPAPALTQTPTAAPISGEKIVCGLKTPELSYDPFYGHSPSDPKVIKTDANGWPIPAVILSWKDGKNYKVWGGVQGTMIPTKEDLTPPLPDDESMATLSALLQKEIKRIIDTKIKPLSDSAASPYVDINIKRGQIYHYILSDTKIANLSQCANTGDIAEGTIVVYTGSCPGKGAIFGSTETAGSDSDCK